MELPGNDNSHRERMKSSFLFKTSGEEEEGAQGPDLVFIMCSWSGGLCMSACMTSHPSDLSLVVSLLMGCAFETCGLGFLG